MYIIGWRREGERACEWRKDDGQLFFFFFGFVFVDDGDGDDVWKVLMMEKKGG